MNNKNKKGFTLIELIIVIAIIGILGAILIPSIMNYVKKAKTKAAIADTKVIKSAVETALVEHMMCSTSNKSACFNKVLYLDQNANRSQRRYEKVGAFTNRSWYVYRTNRSTNGLSESQKVDRIIAGALDNSVSEKWETGQDFNPLAYNSATNNCAKCLKDKRTNFAIVVVYNTTGTVRLLQIYRNNVLVTYVNGEYIVNMNNDAHFIGQGTWNKIYTDSGKESPDEFFNINLSNQQINDQGNLGGWY